MNDQKKLFKEHKSKCPLCKKGNPCAKGRKILYS